ncbi:MAG: antibiotic biosynthesis monooxygenase [Nitrospira sp. CG24B]|nr:MAG: antibiotic biosynthesis monooxygenase [Nitrospira sp. CG24B]
MTPDTSLRVIARVRAKTEHVAQVREILSALVEPTRRESGCLSYELLQNGSDPADFVFVEKWASAAAEQAHFATPHVSVVLQQVVGLLAAEPEICRYRTLK